MQLPLSATSIEHDAIKYPFQPLIDHRLVHANFNPLGTASCAFTRHANISSYMFLAQLKSSTTNSGRRS